VKILVIKLSNEDFANLEKDINATFDQFTVRLKKEYPMLIATNLRKKSACSEDSFSSF